MDPDYDYHVVPICFVVRSEGSREEAALFVRDTLASLQEWRAIGNVTDGRVIRWWLPNDPGTGFGEVAGDRDPSDLADWHLDWHRGPSCKTDLGNGIWIDRDGNITNEEADDE